MLNSHVCRVTMTTRMPIHQCFRFFTKSSSLSGGPGLKLICYSNCLFYIYLYITVYTYQMNIYVYIYCCPVYKL